MFDFDELQTIMKGHSTRFYMMRNKIVYTFCSLLWLLAAGKTYSQQTPPPTYSAGMQVSYIKSWEASAPETNPATLITRPLKDVKQTTVYVDGLGRPVQTVMKQGSLETSSGSSADLVSAMLYDPFGREQFKYLPFAANNTGGNTSINDGLFKSNPFQQQVSFYNTQLSGQTGEINIGTGALNWAYTQQNIEASPLNRPLENFAPGASWVGTSGDANINNHHAVKASYWTNTATDDIKIWTVTDVVNGWGTYAISGVYAAGTLIKNVTTDEKNNQVIEFKDQDGKVIVKKVQLTATSDAGTGSGYTGWLCTYYIYDILNNLRCVVQPQGVNILAGSSWTMAQNLLDEQCFRYEYDARIRMIRKKVPGSAEVYMVYDALDRLVMMQDGNQRTAGKWLITKYDILNRPIETGLLTDATTPFSTHLSNAYISTSYPSTASGYEQLSITHYDDYTSLPAGLSSSLLTTWNSYLSATNNSTWPYPQMPAASTAVKGMITWTQTKILNSSPVQFISSVSIYDAKARVVQVQSSNISGGIDVVTSQYNWSGQPLVTVQAHQKNGSNAQTTTMVTQLTYDDLGRLVKTEKKAANSLVNSGTMPGTFKTTSQLQYDKLGQLTTKIISPTGGTGGTPLETLNYDYNIRGWMLGINKAYLNSGSNTSAYFGMELDYDKDGYATTANKQFNGNIGATVWRSQGDGERRKYDFNYDAANRILKADFNQQFGSQWLKTDPNSNYTIDFSSQMGDGTNPASAYDANGNILQMQQWGLRLNASPQIDNLSYQYQSNSNKLAKVTDAIAVNNQLGDFKDGSNGATDDYSYDANGNMNVDNNKAIGSITYNHLNLPSVITVAGKGTITYTYDAGGIKLQKTTFETSATVPYNGANYSSSITTTTSYINGFVYESKAYGNASLAALNYTDVLQFTGHEEGRIRFKAASGTIAASLQYDYMIRDHLGNVRMVLTEEQQVDKYPFASLEDAKVSTESAYYNIDVSKIVPNSAATGLTTYTNNDNGIGDNPSDASFEAATSQKLYQLNSNTNKTGLGITLKVMAGDKLDIYGKSYWFTANTGGSGVNVAPTVLDLLTGLMGAPTGAAAGGHTTATELNNLAVVNNPAGLFISDPTRNDPANPTRPKAFINYIFLDEQFRPTGSGFSAVSATAGAKNHHSELQNLMATKNGYVYIYVSNESPVNVFFDNLQVVHTRGRILEESHYYPFGLSMSGISSKAINPANPSNRNKYNGKEEQRQEFLDGSGLEWLDYGARMLDNQIGRWHVIDPLSDQSTQWSCYAYVNDNPIRYIDPDGRRTDESPVLKSVDLDEFGKVIRVNDDGDPGVYLRTGQNTSILIGYMDPNVKYIIGSSYRYYGKRDYYIKNPVVYWLGIKISDPKNPDQNNAEAEKRNAGGEAALLLALDGLGELFEVGNAARKGVSVIGPRATYRQFARQIGARYLDVADEAWTWAKNEKFLAGVVARGDDVIFAGKFNPAQLNPESTLAKEIEYLIERGYKWTADFSKLVKQ